MSRDCLLALDLGSTGVRALVLDPERRVAGRAYRPVPSRFPAPGHVEQDPEELRSAATDVLRGALADSGFDAGRIAAIGLATQRSTALAWDARSGEALAPAISWQDQRARGVVTRLRARGVPITTLPSAVRFQWWLERPGPVRDAARAGRLRLGTPDVWLTHHLTGGRANVTDPGQASSTGLYHLKRGDWGERLLELFGVSAEQLPSVVPTCAVVGETPRVLFGASIPVAARAGDHQASAFAHGMRGPGASKLTLGTLASLDVHAGFDAPQRREGFFPLALWRMPDGRDSFLLEGTVISAGASVEWLVGLGLLPAAHAIENAARSVPDAGGVCFVPSLQGLGTPHFDENARGFIGGLTRGTGRAHLARACLEGIAQRCADMLEALPWPIAELPVDGGLAASDLLLERIASYSGCVVLRSAEREATAVGTALLAGVAVGRVPEAADGPLAPAMRFEPALSDSERRSARERWRQILDERVREAVAR